LPRILRPTATAIDEAARALLDRRLVAFPTETVYGLGGLASDGEAVASIYRAKGRPAHNPLILHVVDTSAARLLGSFDQRAEAVASAFWPGPLTLVLTRLPGAGVAPGATAGLGTVAIRVPSHPVAQALLHVVAAPVAAPSANPSGRVSPTTAEHVAADLCEAVTLVLDGGPCAVGLESTVVDLSGERPRLLRPGGLPRGRLVALLGDLEEATDAERPTSPGQLASHYAPRLPVRLDVTDAAPDEALLAFGPDIPPGPMVVRNLSPTGDPGEAARNLFAMLRELDRSGAVRIAVMPIPGDGLSEAIRDRLRRAAVPRPG
jgi:L-threonylcarbamoyladenylate synthase